VEIFTSGILVVPMAGKRGFQIDGSKECPITRHCRAKTSSQRGEMGTLKVRGKVNCPQPTLSWAHNKIYKTYAGKQGYDCRSSWEMKFIDAAALSAFTGVLS